MAGRAAQSEHRIVEPQVRLDPMALSELADPEAWLDPGWSLLALPLSSGGRLLGVLSCYSRGDRAGSGPAALDVSLDLDAVAPLLAGALVRARGVCVTEPPESASRLRRRVEAPFV